MALFKMKASAQDEEHVLAFTTLIDRERHFLNVKPPKPGIFNLTCASEAQIQSSLCIRKTHLKMKEASIVSYKKRLKNNSLIFIFISA